MRFHFGFSKYICIKALFKWGLLILTGLFAFFGIDNITAKALTDTQAPHSVKKCNYNGLFTDSNCSSLSPYNCSLSGWASPFSCYSIPATTSEDLSNIKLDKKSVWYEYTSSTSGNCNTSQVISFEVQVMLNDQLIVNGLSSPLTASDGPFVANALDYNAWNNVTPTTRGVLKSSNSFMNLYWKYLDGENSKNQTGVKIYAYSNSTGYQQGNCTFVNYGSLKTVRFLCTAPAKMSSYWVGQNIYNNNGGLSTSNVYVRNAQFISNVSDPCANSGSDMSSVTSSINTQTGQMVQGFSSIISNNNSNTDSINNNLNDIKNKQDTTNNNLNDIKNNQDTTNILLQDIKANTQNSGSSSGDSTNCNKLNVQQMKNTHGKQLDLSNGTLIDNVNFTVTDYTMFTSIKSLQGWSRICFYDTLKGFLSCQDSLNGTTLNVPTGAVYFRFSYSSGIDPNNVNVHYCSNLYGGESIDPFNSSDYNGGYSDSQVMQEIINLPFDLVQMVLNNVHTCGNYRIDLSSITRRWGGYDYTLVLPCIRNKVKTLMGDEWYNLFDYIMCAIVFYYFAMNVYLKVDSITSGGDGFPTFFKSKGRTTSYYNAHVDDSTGEVTR